MKRLIVIAVLVLLTSPAWAVGPTLDLQVDIDLLGNAVSDCPVWHGGACVYWEGGTFMTRRSAWVVNPGELYVLQLHPTFAHWDNGDPSLGGVVVDFSATLPFTGGDCNWDGVVDASGMACLVNAVFELPGTGGGLECKSEAAT